MLDSDWLGGPKLYTSMRQRWEKAAAQSHRTFALHAG